MQVLQVLLGALVAGGCLYLLLVLVAVCSFRLRRSGAAAAPGHPVRFTVLKPLAGDENGLERNLHSFQRLEYPSFEILMAAPTDRDPALVTAHRLMVQDPPVSLTFLVVGEPACQNAKVHSLAAMTEVAGGEILVVSDSDIRTDSGLLRSLAREFRDPAVGVVTCPYIAVPGRSLWSRLEAVGMNTGFWSGVLVAQFLFPMDFAVGPTMAVRRTCLNSIGGWKAVEDHLAEDFRIGWLARRAGWEVVLGRFVVQHRIGSQGFRSNLAHRLRWRRSSRRSRPFGYWGEVFVSPLPWALLLVASAGGAAWSQLALGVCGLLRVATALATGWFVLGDRPRAHWAWMLPLEDLISLIVWIGGFFGRHIVWRDRVYRLTSDGRLRRINGSTPASDDGQD